jgi:hypothetical protein
LQPARRPLPATVRCLGHPHRLPGPSGSVRRSEAAPPELRGLAPLV